MTKKNNRLDKIYTRSGDSGKTSLALGKRISKSDNHIKALGDVDELNCQIGVLITHLDSHQNSPSMNNEIISSKNVIDITACLSNIQNTLFDIGAEIAMNDQQYPALKQHFIDELETMLDLMNTELPALKEFILPGGNMPAAQCHLARAVCRRAERQLIELSQSLSVEKLLFEQPIKYLNRLSDFLFVAARYLNHVQGNDEVYWQAKRTTI